MARLTWIAIVLALATGLIAGDAAAGEPTDVVRRHVERAREALETAGLPPDRRADVLLAIARDMFDFETMAQRALGIHWRDRTPAERHEYVELFTTLLQRTYSDRIAASADDAVITWIDEDVRGDTATVVSRVRVPSGVEVAIDYLMQRDEGRWRVYDLRVEGLSLVANYRAQFNRILASEGYDTLLRRLRERLAEAAAGDGAVAAPPDRSR